MNNDGLIVETAWSEQNWPLTAQEESLHCDVCWVLIPHDYRESYFKTGLCEFCDARLNPYPYRPYRDDPRLPAKLVC
jgi:hypothetical protein